MMHNKKREVRFKGTIYFAKNENQDMHFKCKILKIHANFHYKN